MHPDTARGIETHALAKMQSFVSNCMHPNTACGIETESSQNTPADFCIACILIPLAVLKPFAFANAYASIINCMHPNTARGIETMLPFPRLYTF